MPACAIKLPIVLTLTAVWAGLAGMPAAAPAQDDLVPVSPTAQQRAELYQALSREVAVFERFGSVLKLAVKLATPSVVHIEAEKDDPADELGRRERIEEAGSGVVVELDGSFYVLTNNHVVKDARPRDITIIFADYRELHPKQVWSDPETDVAVMAVEDPELVPAPVGDSSVVEIGDFVLAIGSPFGLSHSVTYGIISAKGRRDLDLAGEGVRYQDFIQTDAAINPGNSGGPLLNLRGELIGINTAIASNSGGNEGIGFSIPINMVMAVARQLIDRGRVERAYLGVNLDRHFSVERARRLGLPGRMGARITKVLPDSPAEAADLQPDDVILRFGETPVEDDAHLVNLVSLTAIGTDVDVTVYRDDAAIHVTVRVGEQSSR